MITENVFSRLLILTLLIHSEALGNIDCSFFLEKNPSKNLPAPARPTGLAGIVKRVWPRNWTISGIRRALTPAPEPPVVSQYDLDRARVIAKMQAPLERDEGYVTFRVIPALVKLMEQGVLPNGVNFERDYEVVILRAQGEIPFEVYAAIPIYSELPVLKYQPASHGKLEKSMTAKTRQVFFFHPFKFEELYSLKRENDHLEGSLLYVFQFAPDSHEVLKREGDDAARALMRIYRPNAALQIPVESIRGGRRSSDPRFDFVTLEHTRDKHLLERTYKEYGPSLNMVHGVIAAGKHAFWKPEMIFDVIPIFENRPVPDLLKVEIWEGAHEFTLGERITQFASHTERGGVNHPKAVFLQATPLSRSQLAETKSAESELQRVKEVVLDSIRVKTGFKLSEDFFQSYPEHGFDLFRFENRSGDFQYFFMSHGKGKARTYDQERGYGPVSFLDLKGETLRLEISPGEFLILDRSHHDSNNVSLYFGNEADILRHIHSRVQDFEAEGGYENWRSQSVMDATQGEVARRYSEILEESLANLLGRENPGRAEVATTVRTLREAINRLNDLISEFEIVSSEKEVIQLLRAIHHKSEGQKLENLRDMIGELRNFLEYRDFLIRQIIAVYRNLEETLSPRYEDLRDVIATKSDPLLAQTEVEAFESGVGFFLFGNGQIAPLQVHLVAAGQHLVRNQKLLSLLHRYEIAIAARQEKLDEATRIEIWENLVQIMNPQTRIE